MVTISQRQRIVRPDGLGSLARPINGWENRQETMIYSPNRCPNQLIHGVETSGPQKLNPKWITCVYIYIHELCGLWTATFPCCTSPAQVRDYLQTLNTTHAPLKFGKFTMQQCVIFKQPLLNVKWITSSCSQLVLPCLNTPYKVVLPSHNSSIWFYMIICFLVYKPD